MNTNVFMKRVHKGKRVSMTFQFSQSPFIKMYLLNLHRDMLIRIFALLHDKEGRHNGTLRSLCCVCTTIKQLLVNTTTCISLVGCPNLQSLQKGLKPIECPMPYKTHSIRLQQAVQPQETRPHLVREPEVPPRRPPHYSSCISDPLFTLNHFCTTSPNRYSPKGLESCTASRSSTSATART